MIAATNHRSILDRALFRRFDMILTYELPDAKQAAAVLRGRLGSLAPGVRWLTVARHADGLSHADLVRAAESAAKSVLLRGEDAVTQADLTRNNELVANISRIRTAVLADLWQSSGQPETSGTHWWELWLRPVENNVELAHGYAQAPPRDCKVVITGDHEQLGAVEGGGGMAMLARRLGFVQLTEPQRFTAAWEREATLRLRASWPAASATARGCMSP